jgi:phosphate transport system substrate-binding protein
VNRTVPIVLVAGAIALAACGSSSSSSSSNTTAAPAGTSAPAGTTAPAGTSAPAGTTAPASGGGSTTLQESGSSLMFPYLEGIVGAFHTANPSITVAPAAGGSGQGVSDAEAGTTDFGASDAYLSPSEMATDSGLLNIPVVVSSQAVDYNLKGIKDLKLSGPVLAGMYLGTITKWNDPAIAKLNPGVTLPSEAVHPVHRSDSSGDTFLFSSYLSDTDPTFSSKVGPNEVLNLPSVATSAAAKGNPGMVQSCGSTPGCVAYIGISAQASAVTAGLGEAELENASGKFVQSSPTTVDAAVAAAPAIPASLAVSLIDTKGAGAYPIVNFEYIIVKNSAKNGPAIQTFLDYIISPTGGSAPAALSADNFEALPASLVPKVKAAIQTIK